MLRIPILIATVLLLHCPCYSEEPASKRSAPPAVTEVPVSVRSDKSKGELLLLCPKALSVGTGKTVSFSVHVVNHMEEEVFVQVRNSGGGGLPFGWSPVKGEDYGGLPPDMGEPLSSSTRPDLLALLEAAWRGKDGKIRACGCCLARIEGTLDLSSVDIKQVIGKRLAVEVPIRGYFRANGSEFSKSVEAHVLVTK